MRLKWSKAQSKYINQPIPVTERDYSQAIWAVVFIVSLSGLGYFIWQVIK